MFTNYSWRRTAERLGLSLAAAGSVAFLFLGFIQPRSACWANGTAYYFDVNGTTAGFGSPSGTYNENGSYWSTSSAGTVATVAFPANDQLTFGAASTDFTNATFTINMNSNQWVGLFIASSSANITDQQTNRG